MDLTGGPRPRHSLLVLLLAVTCVPAMALGWVSWRMLEQDRALASQRLQERLEYAADAAVLSLERRLEAIQAELPSLAATPAARPADAVLFVARAAAIEVHPAPPLMTASATPAFPDPPPEAFEIGERLEYQDRNPLHAASAFRQLTSSADASIRAGAWVRVARALRKAGRPAEAQTAYTELRKLDAVRVGDTPAGLLAAHGHSVLLRDLDDRAWRASAAALLAELLRGRWTLDRPTFDFHAGELRDWLAAARAGAAGVDSGNRPGAVFWRATADGVVALVGGPEYVSAHLLDAIQQPGLRVAVARTGRPTGNAADAEPVAVRDAGDTGLPWSLQVMSANAAADLAALAMPRGLMLSGMALIALVVSVGTYAVTRAVTRELAVARLQSSFVTAVSHEFRSPVTALRHLTEMLGGGHVSGEERVQQYYGAIGRETERLHRLVDSLLDFGRMEAGKREYRFETVDAQALVEQVVAEFKRDMGLPPQRIDVSASAIGGERAIQADAGALSRAIWNLLDNAVKYSPADVPVHVDVARQHRSVLIHVVDAGPGIPSHERATVFDRFVRGSAAAAAHVGGTGLGLAIVRHIARAHGGEVTVESEPGRGARFTVALPAGSPPPR